MLSSPYTHPASLYRTSQHPHDTGVPSDPSFPYADVEESFCQALRSSGIAMVVVFEPNQGSLVNITGHTVTMPDLSALTSNPLFWGMKYLQPDWQQILRGDLNKIKRVRNLMLLFLSVSLQCTSKCCLPMTSKIVWLFTLVSFHRLVIYSLYFFFLSLAALMPNCTIHVCVQDIYSSIFSLHTFLYVIFSYPP